jgi:hypothetical protein
MVILWALADPAQRAFISCLAARDTRCGTAKASATHCAADGCRELHHGPRAATLRVDVKVQTGLRLSFVCCHPPYATTVTWRAVEAREDYNAGLMVAVDSLSWARDAFTLVASPLQVASVASAASSDGSHERICTCDGILPARARSALAIPNPRLLWSESLLSWAAIGCEKLPWGGGRWWCRRW